MRKLKVRFPFLEFSIYSRAWLEKYVMSPMIVELSPSSRLLLVLRIQNKNSLEHWFFARPPSLLQASGLEYGSKWWISHWNLEKIAHDSKREYVYMQMKVCIAVCESVYMYMSVFMQMRVYICMWECICIRECIYV